LEGAMGESSALSLSDYEQLVWLASRGIVVLCEDGGNWRAMVPCGDVFRHAADAEDLDPWRVAEVRGAYGEYGWDGVVAWISERRGTEPMERFRTPEYLKARAFLEYWKDGVD